MDSVAREEQCCQWVRICSDLRQEIWVQILLTPTLRDKISPSDRSGGCEHPLEEANIRLLGPGIPGQRAPEKEAIVPVSPEHYQEK